MTPHLYPSTTHSSFSHSEVPDEHYTFLGLRGVDYRRLPEPTVSPVTPPFHCLKGKKGREVTLPLRPSFRTWRPRKHVDTTDRDTKRCPTKDNPSWGWVFPVQRTIPGRGKGVVLCGCSSRMTEVLSGLPFVCLFCCWDSRIILVLKPGPETPSLILSEVSKPRDRTYRGD